MHGLFPGRIPEICTDFARPRKETRPHSHLRSRLAGQALKTRRLPDWKAPARVAAHVRRKPCQIIQMPKCMDCFPALYLKSALTLHDPGKKPGHIRMSGRVLRAKHSKLGACPIGKRRQGWLRACLAEAVPNHTNAKMHGLFPGRIPEICTDFARPRKETRPHSHLRSRLAGQALKTRRLPDWKAPARVAAHVRRKPCQIIQMPKCMDCFPAVYLKSALTLHDQERNQATFASSVASCGPSTQNSALARLESAGKGGCAHVRRKPCQIIQMPKCMDCFPAVYLKSALTLHDPGKKPGHICISGRVLRAKHSKLGACPIGKRRQGWLRAC